MQKNALSEGLFNKNALTDSFFKQNCVLILSDGIILFNSGPINIHDIYVCQVRPEGISLSIWDSLQPYLTTKFNEETKSYHFGLTDLQFLDSYLKKNCYTEDAYFTNKKTGYLGMFLLPSGVKIIVVELLGNTNDY